MLSANKALQAICTRQSEILHTSGTPRAVENDVSLEAAAAGISHLEASLTVQQEEIRVLEEKENSLMPFV